MDSFVDVTFVNAFASLLALLAITGAMVLLVTNLVRKTSRGNKSSFARACEQIVTFVSNRPAQLVFIVTGTSMAGSLYYSEIVGYTPCTLCWYQRIAMYSLAIISFVAVVRKNGETLRQYSLVLAVIGAAISTYHTWLQAFPRVTSFCSTDAPCSERHVWEFGFVSIPLMALAAFLFVIMVSVTKNKVNTKQPGV